MSMDWLTWILVMLLGCVSIGVGFSKNNKWGILLGIGLFLFAFFSPDKESEELEDDDAKDD